jgi:peptidyl-prolyl cis-trans isomerase D
VLEALRKYSSGRAIKFLYGLLALTFVGWGASTRLMGQSHLDVLAEVQGERITRGDLDGETRELQQRFQQLFQGAAPSGIDFRGEALDRLIDDALLRHEADRLGIEVSDEDIVRAITEMPELQQNGQFDRELLERVLREQRDRGEFERQVRQDLVNQRVRGLVVDGVQVTDAEVADRYALDRDRVDLQFARVVAADLAAGVQPTDEELAKWLEEHADRYRTPPRVRVRYVAYRPEDFAAMATPSDAAVQQYYDEHADERFTEPEEVHARHILVRVAPNADDKTKADARAKAEAILAQVKGGGDFAAIAKKESQDPGSADKGGDLGFFPRGRMVPQFDAVAFTLEPGQVSDVVETPFGFHVIEVEEKKPGGRKPLDAVRDQIVKTLEQEKGMELAQQQADADRRKIVQGTPLEKAVGDRKVQETPPFAQDAVVPGVGHVKAFNDAAFNLDPNEPSDLIETDDAVYLLEPIERVAPAVPPLADVRDRVVADVKQARGQELAKQKAEQVRARAAEVGLAKAAEEAGLKVEETGPFERRAGGVPKLAGAGDLHADAFTLTPDKPVAPKVYTAGSDAVVVALKDRLPADPAGLEAAKASLRDQILREKQQLALEQFLSYLKERAQKEGALEVRADAVRS